MRSVLLAAVALLLILPVAAGKSDEREDGPPRHAGDRHATHAADHEKRERNHEPSARNERAADGDSTAPTDARTSSEYLEKKGRVDRGPIAPPAAPEADRDAGQGHGERKGQDERALPAPGAGAPAPAPRAGPEPPAQAPAPIEPEPAVNSDVEAQEPAKVPPTGPVPSAEPALASPASPDATPVAAESSSRPTLQAPSTLAVPVAAPASAPPEAMGGGESAPPRQDTPFESFRRTLGSLINETTDDAKQAELAQAKSYVHTQNPWMIWGLGAVFGAGLGLWGARGIVRRFGESKQKARLSTRIKRARREPAADEETLAPAHEGLESLVLRVNQFPLDARACFQLGVELLRLGIDNDGIRLLDRSIRLNPANLLRLLKSNDCAVILKQQSVRRYLTQVKRDADRRAWSGYA